MADSSQKFIARNRAPRVQIEYDVELYGSEKKVQLPFVMGVMSDLAGKSLVPQPSLEDRKFLEIDVDNFDERMRAMQPRAAFSVPNTLTGDGNLNVDLTFERLEDFSPAAIARKIEPLNALLEARSKLSDLMAYMDGKSGAEALLETILNDKSALAAIASDQTDTLDAGQILDSLREKAPEPVTEVDESASVLQSLRDNAPAGSSGEDIDETQATLDRLASVEISENSESDTSDATLESLQSTAGPKTELDEQDDTENVLSALAADAPEPADATDGTQETLNALAANAPSEPTDDTSDNVDDTLASLSQTAPAVEQSKDDVNDILAGMDTVVPPEESDSDSTDASAILAAIPEATQSHPDTSIQDVLADVPEIQDEIAPDNSGDVLAELAETGPPEETVDEIDLDALLGDLDVEPTESTNDSTDDTLAALADTAPTEQEPVDDVDDILAGMDSIAPPDETDADTTVETLSNLAEAVPEEAPDISPDPSAILAAIPETDEGEPDTSLHDVLADIPDIQDETIIGNTGGDTGDDTGDILAELAETNVPNEPTEPDEDIDLDALLGDLDVEPEKDATDDSPEPTTDDLDLDDLLDDLDMDDEQSADSASAPTAEADPTDVESTEDDLDLDDLLADLDEPLDGEPKIAETSDALNLSDDADISFGSITQERPDSTRMERKRFRIALLGDFSGRAAKGDVEIGDALANRRAIALDPDTIDDVIQGFATTLVLPIGKDGAGIEVKLNELDDLHPDELFEKVELFSALNALKSQLSAGATAQSAQQSLARWGEEFGKPVAPTNSRSYGNAVPADRRLSDFQSLIGDTQNRLASVSPLDDLLARIVGPHIRAIPSDDVTEMQNAVDQALSSAMRLVLHHPEFQNIESQWRSLDLIARQIETDDSLDVVLYDVSAEEIAADLAAVEDLSQTGLMRLLSDEPMNPETGRGGYSALIGFYTFEETPPHAELLARIARIAAHLDAPFFASISPTFMETDKADRHPLVATAWDTLRAMPEAGHVGIASPRFMLRRQYGAKTEPVYEFPFEEFTMQSGLGGMLWANPVVLVSILLAQSFRKNGPSMSLGSVLSLGDMPYHYVNDKYGDQVALPCTERNITEAKLETVLGRGFMPVVSIKGRDVIRLGSFQSLAGKEILGPWTGVAPPPPSPAKPDPIAEPDEPESDDTDVSDDIGDLDELDDLDDELANMDAPDDDLDIDLDDLLAEFGDDSDDDDADSGDVGDDENDIDAELAALLEDL